MIPASDSSAGRIIWQTLGANRGVLVREKAIRPTPRKTGGSDAGCAFDYLPPDLTTWRESSYAWTPTYISVGYLKMGEASRLPRPELDLEAPVVCGGLLCWWAPFLGPLAFPRNRSLYHPRGRLRLSRQERLGRPDCSGRLR